MSRQWVKWCAAVLFALVLPAQDRLSAVAGTVWDDSGAPVPGVRIVARHLPTGNTRTVVTGPGGEYKIDRLELGPYHVVAEKDGFRASRHEAVVLAVDRTGRVDHRLTIGRREESIVVAERAQLIESAPSALTSLVDAATIEQLPLNGRDFMQLAAVQAGAPVARAVDRDVNTGYGLQLSISGSRPFQNSFRLDGLQISSYNGATPGSINGINLGSDAIAEFSVNGSSFGASGGQAAGGVINAVTRAGGNTFHGAALYFHRNDNLDARNFFDGEKAPEFRRHQYGASLGGPIRRNRTFFFANAESFLEERGATAINTTISPSARQGILSAGTVRVDPAIAKVLPLYPLPNGPVLGDTGLFSFANDVIGTQHFLTTRLDRTWRESDMSFFRFSRDIGARQNQADFAIGEQRNSTRHHAAVLEHTHIFSPSWMNTTRAGFLRTGTVFGRIVSTTPGTDVADLAYTPNSGVLGLLVVTGITDHPGGTGATGGDRHAFNSFQLSDDLSFVRSRHSLRAGVRLERTHLNTDSQVRPLGEFRFRNLASFLTNTPDRFRGMLPGADTVRGQRQSIAALYFEDNWRISRRLTLDAGLRWEWASVPAEVNGKVSNLINLSDPQLRVGGPLFENPSWKNVVPRAGLAWDLFGNGATLLRAGFGLHPDLLLTPYIMLTGVRNPPFFLRGEVRPLAQGDFPKGGYDALLRATSQQQNVERIPTRLSQPMVRHWNWNLEQRLSSTLSARAAYIGSSGSHLSNIVSDANLVQPVTQPDGRLFFPAGGTVINPLFGVIRNRRFDADSSYHGLQTWLIHRLHRGAQFQLTYTFSKSIDDSSNFSSSSEAANRGLLPFDGNPHFNRGLSGHDVRHYLTASGYWELPFRTTGPARHFLQGWQLAGIITATSGLPTTVALGYDAARTLSHQTAGNIAQRPDLAPGAPANPVTGDPNAWVQITAFQRPQPGYLGNLGRNTVAGPSLANADVSATKRFRLPFHREAVTIDLRVEFFNVLNHTNFRLPSLERMESFYENTVREDFARITTSEESREIQLGIKIRF